jgi:type IV secretory pathway TrbF-like protein
MDATVADLNLKSTAAARRSFAELEGFTRLANTRLWIALTLVSLLAAGLLALNFRTQTIAAQVKPMIIRIDEVGRAQAVDYDTATAYQPHAVELKYFLSRFVVNYFSRVRATLRRDFPEALYFLDPTLLQKTMTRENQATILNTFSGRDTGTDEVEIKVKNITLSDLSTAPYQAAIYLDRLFYTATTHQASKPPAASIVTLEFHLTGTVPNSFVPVNPLGLQVTSITDDQAFQ